MLKEQSIQDLLDYLAELDESREYIDFDELLSQANNILKVSMLVNGEELELTIAELLFHDQKAYIQFNFFDEENFREFGNRQLNFKEDILNSGDLQTYVEKLDVFLRGLEEEREHSFTNPLDNTTGTVTFKLLGVTGSEGEDSLGDSLSLIKEQVQDWVVGDITYTDEDGEEQTIRHDADSPKVPNVVPKSGDDLEVTDEGLVVNRGSKDFYTSIDIQVNEDNQYTDVEGGVLRYPEGHPKAGEPITPHFRIGQAADVFEGLSAHQTFIIQQQLMELGMDISKIDNFTPGVIDFQSANSEINFLATMMQSANDLQAQFTNNVFIDYDAPSVMGQLAPYIEFKKSVDRDIDVPFEKELSQYASEVLPPTETEVKAAIDELFLSKGLTPTAQDYQKYGGIITGLRSQAAARELEIEKNKLTLTDIMGLAQGEYTVGGDKVVSYGGKPGAKPTEFKDVSFGVSLPSPEEAREQLGKPLLTPFDVNAELEKIFESREADRILGGQELMNRKLQAAQFRKNFMEFEDAF